MIASTELKQQRAKATDPTQDDQLTEQIAEAEKLASFACAKQAQEQIEKLNENRRQAEESYKKALSEIEALYSKMAELDDKTFDAVGTLFRSVHSRFEIWEKISSLLNSAKIIAEKNNLPIPNRKPVALFGGNPVREPEGKLLRIWLQRYSDRWRYNGYGEVKKKEIADHGMRGGTGVDDYLERDWNF